MNDPKHGNNYKNENFQIQQETNEFSQHVPLCIECNHRIKSSENQALA